MKKIIIIAAVFLSASTIIAQQYTKEDSIMVEKLLNQARTNKLKRQQECVKFFTRQFYGIPYVAKTLELNKKEKLVINLRQLDCTTYVENVVALSLCVKENGLTFADFCRNLSLIRYRKGGGVNYSDRLHYFTDWINDNSVLGICFSPQSPNPPFSAVQRVSVDYMSTHSTKYPMLAGNKKNMAEIRKTEQNLTGKSYRYIPKSNIDNSKLLRRTIHDGDIIVILTNIKGLDTQHLGFALWKKDGLHLVNASSIRHKVVEEPMLLYTYLKRHKSMTGIRIVRLKDL